MSTETEVLAPEVDATEVETPVVPEGVTPEAPKVEETKEFKPWKVKAPDSQPEHAIPYSRFKDVNDERKTLAAKVEEYEAKVRAYEEKEAKFSEIKSPDDIRIEDYTDPQEYLKARDKANASAMLRQFEEQQLQREQARLVQQQQTQLLNAYQKNLGEAIQRNPEIKEASDFIDRLASEHGLKPHPDVAYELMIDENLGELLYDITTDQALLTEMYQSNPQDFIRKLHKMSAKIDREARYAPKAPAEDELSPLVALEAKKKEIAASIPSQVRGGSPNTQKDPGKMSNAEYRVWRSKNGK